MFFVCLSQTSHIRVRPFFLRKREHANTKHRQGKSRGRVQRAFPYFLCEVRKKQGREGVSMEIGDAVLVPV